MAQPTLALSSQQLMIRVADYLGIANLSGASMAVPSDAKDVELTLRYVNDGYRKFVNSSRWNWLTPDITVTLDPSGAGAQCVSSDAARYFMPHGFYGELLGPWTYPSTGPRRTIQMIHEGRIRELQQSSVATGDPSLVALRPIPNASINTDKVRWEAVFWPTPGTAYVLTARARLYPDALTNSSSEYHVAGYQYDEAILAAALSCAELQRDGVSGGPQDRAWQMALANAILIDRQTTPRHSGYVGDSSDDYGVREQRPYTGVDTYNGATVSDL